MTVFDLILQANFFIDRFLVPLIFAIAFIVFIWGVYKYFIAGGDKDESRETGRKYIFYGLAGFVVMIAVWGLVNLLVASTGLNPYNRPIIPTSGASEKMPGGGLKGSFQGGGGSVGGGSATTGGGSNTNSNTNVNANGNTGAGAALCQTGPTCLTPDSDPCCNS